MKPDNSKNRDKMEKEETQSLVLDASSVVLGAGLFLLWKTIINSLVYSVMKMGYGASLTEFIYSGQVMQWLTDGPLLLFIVGTHLFINNIRGQDSKKQFDIDMIKGILAGFIIWLEVCTVISIAQYRLDYMLSITAGYALMVIIVLALLVKIFKLDRDKAKLHL
ncbi:hypothetical protein [Methanooceanicella nereidis]|nr:hypothetical protein [Methanocella sp. CWC-04]